MDQFHGHVHTHSETHSAAYLHDHTLTQAESYILLKDQCEGDYKGYTCTCTYMMYVYVASTVSTHTVHRSSSRTGTCFTLLLNITRTKHLTGNVHAMAMIPFMAGLALGHYISSFLWHATCTKNLYSLRRLYWGTLSLLQHREP